MGKPKKRGRLLIMDPDVLQRIRLAAAHEDCHGSKLIRLWIERGLRQTEAKIARRAAAADARRAEETQSAA